MKKTLVACAIAWSSIAVARPYVIEDNVAQQQWIEEQKEQLEQQRKEQILKPKAQEYQISIGAFYSYNRFNNTKFLQGGSSLYPQPSKFLVKSANYFISLDRRLSEILGIGVYVQKTATPIKAFKVYTDNPPLTEFALDSQNITGVSLSENSIIAYARQYVAPQNSFDPFFELGLGVSKQHGILRLTDLREYTKSFYNPLIMTLGLGVQKKVTETFSWTASLNFRNQKCAKFYTPGTPSALDGSFDFYRAYDFKLALTYGW